MLDESNESPSDGSAPADTSARPAPAATTRPRRRAASRPAGPPPAVAPSAEAPPAAAAPAADVAPEKKPRKAAKTTKTAKAARAAKASEPAVTAPSAESTPEVSPETDAGPAPRRRTRKKAAPAVFQPPDSAAAPNTEPSSDEKAGKATAVAVFQPPDPDQAEPPKRRRSRSKVVEDDAAIDTAAAESSDSAEEEADAEGEDDAPRRRRRRGGRGRRGRGRGATTSEEGESPGDESDSSDDSASTAADSAEGGPEGEEGAPGSSSRRRRRRRRGSSGDGEGSADDPPNTVVRVREPRKRSDEVSGVRGSTRLEAKKQRRREGREQGRRRPPILTESEFLARRESVDRVMLVRQTGDRTQIAVLEDEVLVEHYVNKAESSSFVGNVYLGRVQNVLPSMEAAFVDIGKGRNAVLYAGEVNWDASGLDGQPRRIEHAIKSGDQLLVQVTKDPIGNKGSRLTAQISLPGRFLVYVPDGSMTGISRKLPDTERTRLKGILKSTVPEGAGVIVRTAAEGASEEELARDIDRLSEQWADIEKKAKKASAPELLYGEPNLAVRVIRDVFNEDVKRLVVSGDDAWDIVEPYLSHVAPDLVDRLSRWTDEQDIFGANRVDEQLAKALDRKVWLPSGGSLVIDRTEAMTVVDVNTGKFTGSGGNLEETVTRNNLEAAEEIVRQLRLRDVGGIIVVDFIDMVLESNRDLVLRRLLECLSRDRTKHQVAEVTSLGLVQMTRKRVGQGLIEAFSEPCDHCGGRGVHIQSEPVVLKTKSESAEPRRKRAKKEPAKDKATDTKKVKETAAATAKIAAATLAAAGKTLHRDEALETTSEVAEVSATDE